MDAPSHSNSKTPSHAAPKAEAEQSAAELFSETRQRLADGDWESWSESEFQRRASASFRHQYETCAPYRALCVRRGVTPENVGAWQEIPAVPATAFKHFDFLSWVGPEPPAEEAGTVFRTSGTTRGAEARGRHPVPRLDLYEASLAEPFRRALLPDVGVRGERAGGALFLSLIPSPQSLPDSSLSFMVGAAARRFASEVLWLVDEEGRWRSDAVSHLEDRLAAARDRGGPLLLLGTALAWLHLLEEKGDGSPAPLLRDLPRETRFMETGGFKGVRRDVSREELYRGIERHTGVSRARVVNEYGMTELLSQLYEPVLTEGAEAMGVHLPPPWLRVRALDPVTLDPVAEGEEGLLAFFDLANLGSVCHVLTEDVGRVIDGRVALQGRAAGAEPRGCSRAMDELLQAVHG